MAGRRAVCQGPGASEVKNFRSQQFQFRLAKITELAVWICGGRGVGGGGNHNLKSTSRGTSCRAFPSLFPPKKMKHE